MGQRRLYYAQESYIEWQKAYLVKRAFLAFWFKKAFLKLLLVKKGSKIWAYWDKNGMLNQRDLVQIKLAILTLHHFSHKLRFS